MKTKTFFLEKFVFIRYSILIIIFLLNCNEIFSQISFRSVESYFVDLTQTKISKHHFSYSTADPDIFVFFYKIQVSNKSTNDIYIQSENSKFIVGEDTIKLLIYTNTQELIEENYLLPKGKSYIYLYCHYNKNEIPICVSLLSCGNFINFLDFKRGLFKTTQIFLANNSPIPFKIKNKRFKIILSEKSKNFFFNKYSLYKFEKDYINFIKGIKNKIDLNIILEEILKEIIFDPIIEE